MTIYEWISISDIGPEDLDATVEEAAADMASNANGEGVKGQIRFLTLIAGWSEDGIKDMLIHSSLVK